MTVLLWLPPDARQAEIPPRTAPPGGGDGRGGGRAPLPVWLAVTLVVLVAIGLTYLGMLTQIWANLSGAQLPGA
ncbi:hypothetical protein BJF90_07595 [Pseudonocardia sp. CNS-004]|nr:hypothetical protein BJF90_07595 [Pseudonocardia sp. CNS-004]